MGWLLLTDQERRKHRQILVQLWLRCPALGDKLVCLGEVPLVYVSGIGPVSHVISLIQGLFVQESLSTSMQQVLRCLHDSSTRYNQILPDFQAPQALQDTDAEPRSGRPEGTAALTGRSGRAPGPSGRARRVRLRAGKLPLDAWPVLGRGM